MIYRQVYITFGAQRQPYLMDMFLFYCSQRGDIMMDCQAKKNNALGIKIAVET